MDTVVLKPLFHRNRECIGLYFDKNQALNVLIKRVTGIKWSQTNKCWYVPLTCESYIQLKTLLKEPDIQVIEELKPYLESKKKGNPVNPDLLVNKSVFQPSITIIQQNQLLSFSNNFNIGFQLAFCTGLTEHGISAQQKALVVGRNKFQTYGNFICS